MFGPQIWAELGRIHVNVGGKGHPSNVAWKAGADPPDFVFKVNDEEWADEETQLHQYIQLRGKPESRQAIEESLAAMCDRIKTRARPLANRDYIIAAFGPVEDAFSEAKLLYYQRSNSKVRLALLFSASGIRRMRR